MPAFIEPQLCGSVDHRRSPLGPGWVDEVKWDGYRMQLRVQEGRATLRSRENIDWTRRMAPLAQAAHVLPDCIIDGEVVALGKNGLPDLTLLNRISQRFTPPPLTFCAFDLMVVRARDLRPLPLSERKDELQRLLSEHPIADFLFVESFKSNEGLYEAACEKGLEGIVRKRVNAPYRSGRSSSWVKIKCP